MKSKRILITLLLLGSFTVFSQQIGSGFASYLYPANFGSALRSGYHNNHDAIGTPPDGPNWYHLFVGRHANRNNNYQLQISSSFDPDDRLFFRKIALGDTTTVSTEPWKEIATRGTNTFSGLQTINGNLYVDGPNLNSQIHFESQSGFHRIAFHELRFWDWEIGETMTINNGNVGIGTTTPTENLSVYANFATLSVTGQSGMSAILLGNQDSNGGNNPAAIFAANGSLYFGGGNSWNKGGNLTSSMLVDDNGNVGIGIGTATPSEKLEVTGNAKINGNQIITGNVGIGSQNPDQKLTVKGKIHSEEIIVDLNVPADYVFQKYYTGKSDLKPTYTMPTLAEVAQYTKANNHLPNIPSAQEIKDNGLELGKMNNLLLQKIEELTLYAIEQQKEMEVLKAQVKALLSKK